ncbi:MAG: cation:proton antiporter [Actinomycetota bacterium]
MDLGVFEQTALILAVCASAGVLAMLLRQPLIAGLIAAGIAIGPAALNVAETTEQIEFLATVGLSLLLFVVGLRLDLRLLRRLGRVALATGLGQIVFTAALGMVLALALGFEPISALYVSGALTFSSTVIVVKLLSDRDELDAVHGRVAIGLLIVQDVVAIAALVLITASGEVGDTSTAGDLTAVGVVVLRGLALIGLAMVMGRYVAPRLVRLFDRQNELLVLTVVTWAFLLASVSQQLGFSAELGAFLAGVSLASTVYRDVVAARLSSLRDFLIVFFFIDLGLRIDPSVVVEDLTAILALSAFVLVGNPLVVMVIMGWLGYRRRTSFKTGLTIAQISEFSLVLVALGVEQGHVGERILSTVIVIGLVTITVSTYLISNADRLADRLPGRRRSLRAPPIIPVSDDLAPHARPEYLVIGVGRLGSTVINDLMASGDRVLGVDVDLRGINRDLADLPIIYGDADDPQLPQLLPLDATRWVISTLRDVETNRHLTASLRSHGYQGGIAVAAEDRSQCEQLQTAGADITVRPLHLAATRLVTAICEGPPELLNRESGR